MNDTIKNIVDSTKMIINDTTNVKSIVENEGSNLITTSDITEIINDPWFFRIMLPIGLLVFGWILRHLYDKYFVIKPKLYLKMVGPLYEQRTKNMYENYTLTWRYECKLVNNSKHDAFDISLFEISPKNEEDKIITNSKEVELSFPSNNNIKALSSIDFEIKKSIEVSPDLFLNKTEENGKTIILPGSKIQNPDIELMPSVLKNINLVVSYKNEKDKMFYTKYRNINKSQSNKLKSRRPFIFKKLVK